MDLTKNSSYNIESLIDEKEEIQWRKKPELVMKFVYSFLIGSIIGVPSGFFVGLFILGVVIELAGGNAESMRVLLFFAGFLIPLILMGIGFIQSLNEEFAITNKNIITIKQSGFSITSEKIPRNNIKEIGIKQNILGEIANEGSIKFKLFESEQETDTIVFYGIEDPDKELRKVKEILSEEIGNQKSSDE